MSQGLTLELTDMAHGGEAVGRHTGKAVFVPYGVPGDLVRVQVVRERTRYSRARLVEVLSPSPQRAEPPCPYFGRCGGCQWQNIEYGAQLEYKRGVVRTQLQRIAGLADPVVRPTLPMSEPWHYRNHVQFAVGEDGPLGFRAAGSHGVVPVERCLLMHPLLEELYNCLDIELPDLMRLSLRAGVRTGEQMVIFETAADDAPEIEVDLAISCVLLLSDGTPVTLLGSPYIHEQVAGRAYRITAPSFFQVNTEGADLLVAQVGEYLRPQASDTLIDAYCGVGTFGLSLAQEVGQVIGVEADLWSVEDAKANGRDLGNVTFVHGSARDVVPALDVTAPLLIVDPPRSGLEPGALSALVQLAPSRLVYVSCDPATLARDIKGFVAAGYALREVQPVDLFPQTYHIESIALLEPDHQVLP